MGIRDRELTIVFCVCAFVAFAKYIHHHHQLIVRGALVNWIGQQMIQLPYDFYTN